MSQDRAQRSLGENSAVGHGQSLVWWIAMPENDMTACLMVNRSCHSRSARQPYGVHPPSLNGVTPGSSRADTKLRNQAARFSPASDVFS